MNGYRVITPAPGTFFAACDTFSDIGMADAAAMHGAGIQAVGLYTATATPQTLANVTRLGMGAFFIIEGLDAATVPTAELGARQAASGVGKLAALGVPDGATIAGDLEGQGRDPHAWIAYSDAQSHTIFAARHIPAVYIGTGIGLTSSQLHHLAAVRYWKSASRVQDLTGVFAEPPEGWCAFQGMPFDVKMPSGLEYDLDALWQDYHGRSFSLVVAA